jgi:hypothetical protein
MLPRCSHACSAGRLGPLAVPDILLGRCQSHAARRAAVRLDVRVFVLESSLQQLYRPAAAAYLRYEKEAHRCLALDADDHSSLMRVPFRSVPGVLEFCFAHFYVDITN